MHPGDASATIPGMAWPDLPGTFLTCLIPSGLFLAFIRGQARRGTLAWGPLALTFVIGMVAAASAFFLFEDLEVLRVYRPLVSGASADDVERAAFFLAVVGPVEECAKLAAVVFATTLLRDPRAPSDCLVLATASALGFATAENWYAMWATGGPDLGRAAVVPFVHMLFAAFWGWGLGESRRRGGASWPVHLGLGLASAYHGLYNYVEYKGGLWHFATLPIVALLWFFLVRTLGDFARGRVRRS